MTPVEPVVEEAKADLLDKGAQTAKATELVGAQVDQRAADVVAALTLDVVPHEKTGAAQIKIDVPSGQFLADVDLDGSISHWSFVNNAADLGV